MSRRHADPVDVVRRDDAPEQFLWHERLYQVREVLAHWVEAGRWWSSVTSKALVTGDGLSRKEGAVAPAPSPSWARGDVADIVPSSETEDVLANAKDKRKRKGADWIIANDVSGDVMGGSANKVHIVTAQGIEELPEMPKEEVGRAIVERIALALAPG